MSPSISIDSKYSFQFPYRQIRAKLIRTSKSDFQENSNYGNLRFETKISSVIFICEWIH